VKHDSLSRALPVRSAAAAACLADSRLRAVLMLFAREARTLRETSAASGLDLKRLHHHAGTLCRAGLLKVEGERRRAGRPMKLYRASSDAFFVLDELLPKPFTESLADELRESLLTHGFRPGRGMLFALDSQGEVRAQRVDPPDSPASVLDLWFLVRLPRSELDSLRAELRAVVERFDRGDRPGARPYLIHAAAAPRVRDI
jgi:hypothetical protein